MVYNLFNMRRYILNKKSLLIILAILLFFSLFYSFFFKSTEAQVCLPLDGYLVWPGTWESGWIPMASTTQYVLTRSPIYVSGSNVGIGTLSPVYTFQVNGDISGTRLCIGSDCRSNWPGGGIAGSGSSGQVTFWIDSTSVGGDNNLFWDNLNKRLGIGTTTPQTSLHVIGNITANTFLGTINASNVSSGQFGQNTGGGNYYFMGNVGIGTTTPSQKLTVAGKIDVTGNRIVNLASPIDSNDAATKGYVDAQSGGSFPSGILETFTDPNPRPGWTYTGFWEEREDTWTTKAPMPNVRAELAAAVVNNIIYAIGGYRYGYLSTNEAYDPSTDTWTTKAPMPTARRNLAAAAVNNIIYAIGGYSTGGGYLSTNEAYYPFSLNLYWFKKQ
jgi:hypothetical protein